VGGGVGVFGGEEIFDDAEVDLGLARAGDAVEQVGGKAGAEGSGDRFDGIFLSGVEGDALGLGALLHGGVVAIDQDGGAGARLEQVGGDKFFEWSQRFCAGLLGQGVLLEPGRAGVGGFLRGGEDGALELGGFFDFSLIRANACGDDPASGE